MFTILRPIARGGATTLLFLGIISMSCGKSRTDTAKEFLFAGQLEQAKEIVEQEIKEHPDNAEAQFLMGWVLLRLERSERTIAKYFNGAILLDEDYRDDIFSLIMSYVDTAIESGQYDNIRRVPEMALRFAPKKTKKAGEILFSKVEPLLKLNPIEHQPLAKVVAAAMEYNPSLKEDVAKLFFESGKLLWDKGFSDLQSLDMIDGYFTEASKINPKLNGKISDAYFEMSKELIDESDRAGVSLRLLQSSYEHNNKKGRAIAEFCLDLAKKSFNNEDFGQAYSLAQASNRYYPAMASDVEALIKKIPVVVEDFENRDGCIFSSVEGRWKFQQSPTGQAYGPTSPKSSVALCAIPFSTGTIEYDFNITGPSYADCDILLSYKDNRNFMRVSICPYRGDSKDRVEIITNGKATQLIQREPSVRRNTWNHVRIDRNANDIRVILNGTEHLYAQCPPPAGDRFALRFWDQGLVDNFSISSSGSASHGNPFWGTISDSDRKSELPQIDTPWKLLKEIHSLASANRYEELERHIFYRHRDQILKGIREHKPHGDFAYSNEALAEIVHNHRSEIRTLPQQYQDEFIKDWKADPTINSVANSRPDDISVFRHEQSTAYILMIKIEGEYKLIFWEDINGILRK